ncbi:hypothetical protein SODG_005060 [Sodalis praecaptivus]
MRKDFQQEASNILIQQVVSGGENSTTATVTIEQSDLLDDAVQAERSIFKLALRDGKCFIDSRINQQRCYPEGVIKVFQRLLAANEPVLLTNRPAFRHQVLTFWGITMHQPVGFIDGLTPDQDCPTHTGRA